MSLSRFDRTFVIFLFLTIPVFAQNKPPLCGVTCEPDSTSGSYAPTFAVRPQTKNARAASSVLAGTFVAETPEPANTLAGAPATAT